MEGARSEGISIMTLRFRPLAVVGAGCRGHVAIDLCVVTFDLEMRA